MKYLSLPDYNPDVTVKSPLVKNALLFCLGLALAGVIGLFVGREQAPVYVQEPKDYSPRTAGDTVAYRRECVDAANPPEQCRSAATIKSVYGVDVWEMLEIEQGRTIMTARRIDDGTLETMEDYERCLKEELCRPVPLPPQKARHNEKLLNAPETVKARKLFRHLADDGSLTPDVCAIIDVCRAMTEAGLLKADGQTMRREGNAGAAGR